MVTHTAVVTASVRGALETRQVSTVSPSDGEVRVRVEWTASTPLTLHQNDGGLLVTHPQILGSNTAGTVVEVGPKVQRLKVGDKVFGFTYGRAQEKSHQEYITTSEYLLAPVSIIPMSSRLGLEKLNIDDLTDSPTFTPQEAVTLCDNFVTVFHSVTADLGLPLAWPVPTAPPRASETILIWGGSSSVGQYALQILRHWGYQNLIATASKPHHEQLKLYGARAVFDYRETDVVERILEFTSGNVPLVLDCIGSKFGSMAPISKIARRGAVVAVLLPVIVRDSSDNEEPVYSMHVDQEADWAEGVDARGVRTHFYLDNVFFKDNLQSVIMPTLLAEGVVKPNKFEIVEGRTLLERAQKALIALRRKQQSGHRLVWQVSE